MISHAHMIGALGLVFFAIGMIGCEQDSDIGGMPQGTDMSSANNTASAPDANMTGDTTQAPDMMSSPTPDMPPMQMDMGGMTTPDMDTADMDERTYPSSTFTEFFDSATDLAIQVECRARTTPSCWGDDWSRTPPFPGGRSQRECEQLYREKQDLFFQYGQPLNEWYYGHAEAVAAGRQTFDATAAGRCIDFLKAAAHDMTPCEMPDGYGFEGLGSMNECEDVLQPAVAQNGACLDADDCIGGLFCDVDAAPDDCWGECVPWRQVGERCEFVECDSGLRCRSGVCEATQDASQVGLGMECMWDSDCRDDLHCEDLPDDMPDDGRRCRAPLGPGQICDFGDCRDDSRCVTDPADPDGTIDICVVNESVAEGGACTHVQHCAPGLICADDNTCTKVEISPRGAPCDGEARFCEAGTVCRPETAGGPLTCTDRATDGDPCTYRSCRLGLFCSFPNEDAVTGTCTPTLAEGTPCTQKWSCAGSLYCNGAVCVARAEPGARCEQKYCVQDAGCRTVHPYIGGNLYDQVCGGLAARCTTP